MSRERISHQLAMLPMNAMPAPIRRISLRPTDERLVRRRGGLVAELGGNRGERALCGAGGDRVGEAGGSLREELPDLRVDARLKDGAERRHPGGDPDLPEGAVDARRHPGAGRLDDADRDRRDARVGHADPRSAEQEAREQRRPAVADLDAVHQHQADTDEQQPGSHQRPERNPVRESRRDRGDDEGEQREGEEAQAGLERRVGEHVLHVERQVQEHREHPRGEAERGDRHPGEGRLAEQGHVEHRVLASQLDGDERRQQDHRGGEAADDHGASPALGVAADQPEDQQEERRGECDEAGPVDRPACRWP